MPSIFKGYTYGEINSYCSITINKNKFNKEENIELTIEFFDFKTISEITHLGVDIVKRKSEHSVYIILTDQFKPNSIKSKLKISASFPKEKYELTVGFFFKSRNKH